MDLKDIAQKLADLERLSQQNANVNANKVPGEQPALASKAAVGSSGTSNDSELKNLETELKNQLTALRQQASVQQPAPQANTQTTTSMIPDKDGEQSGDLNKPKTDTQQKNKPGEPIGSISEQISEDALVKKWTDFINQNPSTSIISKLQDQKYPPQMVNKILSGISTATSDKLADEYSLTVNGDTNQWKTIPGPLRQSVFNKLTPESTALLRAQREYNKSIANPNATPEDVAKTTKALDDATAKHKASLKANPEPKPVDKPADNTNTRVDPADNTNTRVDPADNTNTRVDPADKTVDKSEAGPTNTLPKMKFWDEVADVAKKNNITDANKIYPGQKFTMPSGETVIVKKGDTLSQLVQQDRLNRSKTAPPSANAEPADNTTKVDPADNTNTKVDPVDNTNTKVDPADNTNTKVDPADNTKIKPAIGPGSGFSLVPHINQTDRSNVVTPGSNPEVAPEKVTVDLSNDSLDDLIHKLSTGNPDATAELGRRRDAAFKEEMRKKLEAVAESLLNEEATTAAQKAAIRSTKLAPWVGKGAYAANAALSINDLKNYLKKGDYVGAGIAATALGLDTAGWVFPPASWASLGLDSVNAYRDWDKDEEPSQSNDSDSSDTATKEDVTTEDLLSELNDIIKLYKYKAD